MNMKTMLTFAAVAAVTFAAQAETVLWHFGGRDGEEAPSSIADVSGTYTLDRKYHTPSPQPASYTIPLSQSDSKGSHLWWRTNGAMETSSGASGSVQMYRYGVDANNVTGGYYGVGYQLTDSATVKSLFPTNASGEILPFTLELIFKAEPYDEEKCRQRNFFLTSLNRNETWNRAVFNFACISGGSIYLQCSSGTNNAEVCNTECIKESDFRDGKWHHVALVYTLVEHQGTMNVYLDSVLKKSCTMNDKADVKCLRFKEVGRENERSAQLNFGEMYNSGYGAGYSLDEVRLTQSALDSREFLHAGSLTEAKEKAAGTVARWTFDAPGRSGETVGSAYGAIPSVDGAATYGLRGGTHVIDASTWDGNLTAGGEMPPVFTNDVPYAYIWDPVAKRIANPDNATSVFFKHKSEDGAAAQVLTGSVVNTSLPVADVFPSNFTFECFVKCDKSFGGNVSSVFAFHNGVVRDKMFARLGLQGTTANGMIPLMISYGNTSISKWQKNMADGEWHHIAGYFDYSSGSSTEITLFADYQEMSHTSIAGIQSFNPANVAVAFGSTIGANAFSGFIDEPRITVGNIGIERFLRQFTPREDITGVWLVPTNSVLSGKEWYSPETDYLEGTWESGDIALSDVLPRAEAYVRLDGERIQIGKSVAFAGNGGMTIPCAATVGSKVFTVEANFCGNGTVFAKQMFGGKSSWAVRTTDGGYASVEIDGVTTTTSVNVDNGKWHHAALVVDRESTQTAKLYIDGGLVASVDASGMTLDSGDFVVGEDFVGNIVGVRFSPGVVSPERFLIAGAPSGLCIFCR